MTGNKPKKYLHIDRTAHIHAIFRGVECSEQDQKIFRATDTNKHFICACSFICQICCQKATDQVYQRKTEKTDTVFEPSVSVCSTLNPSVRFSHATACKAVNSTNSFPALSLPDPLYLPSTEDPYTSPITANTFPEPSV